MATSKSFFDSTYSIPARNERGWSSLRSAHIDVMDRVEASITGAGVINVTASTYGAAGDGTTDDTSAIQAAINAVTNYGGLVFFPKGTYLISSTLTLPALYGVRLIGSGRGTILKADAGFSGPMIEAAQSSCVANPEISSMCIWGNDESGVTTAIQMDFTYNGYFSHLIITGIPNGAGILASTSVGSVRACDFVHVRIHDCLKGYRFLGITHTVTRNHIYGGDCGGCGDAESGGIGLEIGDGTHTNVNYNVFDTNVYDYEKGFVCYGDYNQIGGNIISNGGNSEIYSAANRTILRGMIGDGVTDNGSNTIYSGYPTS